MVDAIKDMRKSFVWAPGGGSCSAIDISIPTAFSGFMNDRFFGSNQLESNRMGIHRASLFVGEINSSVQNRPRHDASILSVVYLQADRQRSISHGLP